MLEAALKVIRKGMALVLADKYDEAREPLREAEAMKEQVERCRNDYRSSVVADSKAAGVRDEKLIQSVGEKWSEDNRVKP